MTTTRRAAFLTLGCKVNQYETDAMEELLEAQGYRIVDFRDEADVYIVNTCSVTNMADRKSRQMIHRARKRNPDAVVVAAGCYVQVDSQKLKEKHEADILVGNNCKKDIASILEEYFLSHPEKDPDGPSAAETRLVDIGADRDYEELSISRVSGHTRAYLKIQDGCNQFCSYCIIPYARGRIRSRRPEEVIAEVERLAAAGYKEIVLTGIHVSSYGLDWKKMQYDDMENLAENQPGPRDKKEWLLIDLIEALQQVEGICRIRLSSLEPRIITEDFVDRLVKCDKVCPHFHLSLQSGCDATLKRMNRKYTTKEYEEALALLRDRYDNPALTTDVIAGFVGETEEEFEETYAYLERINLYEMHIFKYSIREGTRAQKMSGHLPDQVKTERAARLLAMTAAHKAAYEKTFIGREMEVLLEEEVEIDGKKYWQGHTKNYLTIAVEPEDNSDNNYENSLIQVKITGHKRGILTGNKI